MRITLTIFFFAFHSCFLYAQAYTKSLEIKPAIGIVGSPFKPTISVLLSYPLTPKWSVASYSLLSFLLVRNPKEQYIKTNYNYSGMQNLGIGYSVYGKKGNASHTIRLLGGVKRVAFSETLDNPGLDEKVTTEVGTIVPEYGAMYDLSLGKGRSTFTTRLYLPLHPIQYYPKGTLNNIAYLELGIGIKLRNNSNKK